MTRAKEEQQMETLYFTKKFTSGTLEGLSVQHHISFPPSERARYAKAFAKGTKGRDTITKDRWIIVDASFQSYAR